MKNIFILLFIILSITSNLYAVEINGVTLPERITVENSNLLLNGAGIRTKLFFNIYVGALYLPEKSSNSNQIINSDIPKQIFMHFLYDEVKKEKIVSSFKDGFEDNSPELLNKIKGELDTFYSCFNQDIKKGDQIKLTFIPNKGTTIEINNNFKKLIPNRDFMVALFSIWFGNNPPTESLKNGMLGLE